MWLKRIEIALIALLGYGLGGRCMAATEPPPYPARPYNGVQYEYRSTVNPPQQIYIAKIDLSNPEVDLRTSRGGDDPDGEGPYETTLQVPSVIAAREKFELAVNGDFFEALQTKDIEGENSKYVPGKWAKVLGPCVTDGVLWGPAATQRPALWMDMRKTPHIAMLQKPPAGATQIIAGSHVLVSGGKSVVENESSFSRTRHPRTAAGIAADGHTLVLAVVDGRRPGEASGMTLTELAALMVDSGCTDALNLDGGGSTEMLVRVPETGALQVLNHPSDGRERAVANVLGISVLGSYRVR